MTLTTAIKLSMKSIQTNPLDLGTPAYPFTKVVEILLGTGVGASSADRLFTDTRTLTASGTENLDLAASLVDAFGSTITMVELRGILITAAAGNTNDVQLTRPASNGVPLFLAASDGIPIGPGGCFLWVGPADGKVTITPATGDLLTVTNSSSGTGVTYDIAILGTSA